MHYLSSVYFVSQPLCVSGIFEAHHQELYCIYTTIGTRWAFQLTVCWPAGHVPCTPCTTVICNVAHILYKYWHLQAKFK